MVQACLVRKSIDDLFGQAPRLKLIMLQRGIFVGITVLRVTTSRAIVNALVRRRTSWLWWWVNIPTTILIITAEQTDAICESVRSADPLIMGEAPQVIAIPLNPFPSQTHLTRQSRWPHLGVVVWTRCDNTCACSNVCCRNRTRSRWKVVCRRLWCSNRLCLLLVTTHRHVRYRRQGQNEWIWPSKWSPSRWSPTGGHQVMVVTVTIS